MKFSAAVDLSPHIAAALARVDVIFTTHRGGVDALRDAKARQARDLLAGAAPHPVICAEAEAKQIAVDVLCAAIVEKADAAQEAALAVEGKRQAAKARIRAAKDQHEIFAALAAVEGQT